MSYCGPIRDLPVDQVNLEAILKTLQPLWKTLWAITAAEESDIHAGLFAGLENGALRPIVGKKLLLADAARAHKEILEPGAAGKIVLTC
jgi:NADPH2:quinone reductase